MPGRIHIIVSFCFLLFFGMLLQQHIKTYDLWWQIYGILYMCGPDGEYGRDPLELFRIHYPHALRFLLVWPLIEFTRFTGITIQTAFSWAVLLMLAGISLLQTRTIKLLSPLPTTASRWYAPVFTAFWLGLALMMNGRMVFVFLGISLILYAQIRLLAAQQKILPSLALQLPGLFLCSVSSGTFTVAFCVIVAFLVSLSLKSIFKQRKKSLKAGWYGLLLVLIAAPQLQQSIEKNLAFFHYSLSEMLLHGPPRLLYDRGMSMPEIELIFSGFAIAVLVAMVCSYLFWLWRDAAAAPIVLPIGFSMVMGIFGYSTLLTMLPATIMTIAFLYLKYSR